MNRTTAMAAAPASIGNVAVGFDMMGLAFGVAEDRVTATRTPEPGVRLGAVGGLVTRLPEDPARNTALRAAQAVLGKAGASFGVVLDVHKGVPMSAGMGGSAASAVAAALAVNALLPEPVSKGALIAPALEGEAASADPPPLDNVVASLLGGLCLIRGPQPGDILALPLPEDVDCLLVHPDLKVETQAARDLLSPTVPLETAVAHARDVAGFVAACFRGDPVLMGETLTDCLVEPQRAPLVPFLQDMQSAVRAEGALGCSLSGSGPSVFAWAPRGRAEAVERAMIAVMEAFQMGHRFYRAPLAAPGARLVPTGPHPERG
ncbi:MAG: homoserine kinase [Alphaproteobacteria bacterium]